jgi:2,3-bisphosphoglycerate-independent phosphoglycerate mutase
VVEVLVIPDGAAQPVHDGVASALEAASTPVLDALAAEGAVVRVATTPPGLPPGSETGIAALLGVAQREPVGRGWVDAAAYGVDVPGGLSPWRADLLDGNGLRASIRQARDACTRLGDAAHAVAGHRIVLLAERRPEDRRVHGLRLCVWDGGPAPRGRVAVPTVIICATGAAAGCGRLLGAEVRVPDGATGDVDTDLPAKARAAIAAISAGAERVVVHVGAPDEAAHRRDPEAVRAVLELLDAELLGPLGEAVAEAGGRLAVCPDHGTDPATGLHDAAPVPAVLWGMGIDPDGAETLSERAAASAPLIAADRLLALPVQSA